MGRYDFDLKKYQKELLAIISELLQLEEITDKKIEIILKKHPKDKDKIFSRDQLIQAIKWQELEIRNSKSKDSNKFEIQNLKLRFDSIISILKLKPTRTISGVTTVTVLTKPFACPGQCIFCPNDIRMPKSYIASEPGAQRALVNRFDPYNQVFNRLKALKNIGHPTEKIELLVLGGTWSFYPKKYKFWFIKECFRAFNEASSEFPLALGEGGPFAAVPDGRQVGEVSKNSNHTTPSAAPLLLEKEESSGTDVNDVVRQKVGNKPYNQLIVTKEYKELFDENIFDESDKYPADELEKELYRQQEINSNGKTRCVGLVLETRPDAVTPEEVLNMRKLGATKVQIGIQTLNNEVSKANKRGETREDTATAFKLLRAGGFKIHGHIMPNLYKSTPEIDRQTYKELFESEEYKPDELKIYPTSLIKNTELYDYWKQGNYKPYGPTELVDLMADLVEMTPEYCRLSRIIRDIPSTEIEGGNKTTNLRQVVEEKLKKEGRVDRNIRAREVKGMKLEARSLKLDIVEYKTSNTTELFLQYITEKREIAGFLRLSLPNFNLSLRLRSSSAGQTALPNHGEGVNPITPELNGCAMIREVHVYGPSLELSKDSQGEAQHLGLGTKLIEKAKEIAKQNGFSKLAVISSIGTREYYEKRGFELKELYQICEL